MMKMSDFDIEEEQEWRLAMGREEKRDNIPLLDDMDIPLLDDMEVHDYHEWEYVREHFIQSFPPSPRPGSGS